jgi:hypothetical protein
METEAVGVEGVYSLQGAAKILAGFVPPVGPHDPEGPWEHHYTVCQLTGDGYAVGDVTLTKSAGGGGPVLGLRASRRLGWGARAVTEAVIRCRADRVSSVATWEWRTETRDATGRAVPGTRLKVVGGARRGLARWTIGGHTRSARITGPLASRWALVDAVQRLGGARGGLRGLDVLEGADHVLRRQTVRYRAAVRVRFPASGAEAGLRAFERHGPGYLPTVYWVDEHGRALFIVSGLEAYLWAPGQGGTGA